MQNNAFIAGYQSTPTSWLAKVRVDRNTMYRSIEVKHVIAVIGVQAEYDDLIIFMRLGGGLASCIRKRSQIPCFENTMPHTRLEVQYLCY